MSLSDWERNGGWFNIGPIERKLQICLDWLIEICAIARPKD